MYSPYFLDDYRMSYAFEGHSDNDTPATNHGSGPGAGGDGSTPPEPNFWQQCVAYLEATLRAGWAWVKAQCARTNHVARPAATACDKTPQTARKSAFKRAMSWFKRKQRNWNDWLFVPLIAYLFISFPGWLARRVEGPIVSFPPSYLGVPVFGVLLVITSFGFAWNFMRAQFPDEIDVIRNFKSRHKQLERAVTCSNVGKEVIVAEFKINELWKKFWCALGLLLFFFAAALAASVAALMIA